MAHACCIVGPGTGEIHWKRCNPTRTRDKANPTQDEKDTEKRQKEGDAKACTCIELSIGDSEMIHISGADTTRGMWEQLTMVKESKGRLGVLATW